MSPLAARAALAADARRVRARARALDCVRLLLQGASKVSTALAIQRALGTDCTTDVLEVHPRRAMVQMEDYYIGDLGKPRAVAGRYYDRGLRGPGAWEVSAPGAARAY